MTNTPTSPTCAECDHECERITALDAKARLLRDQATNTRSIYAVPCGECCICRDTSKYSGMTMNGGMAYCDTCRERSNRHSEAAYERFMEDYYGGNSPVTIKEQYQAAAAQKRRLS